MPMPYVNKKILSIFFMMLYIFTTTQSNAEWIDYRNNRLKEIDMFCTETSNTSSDEYIACFCVTWASMNCVSGDMGLEFLNAVLARDKQLVTKYNNLIGVRGFSIYPGCSADVMVPCVEDFQKKFKDDAEKRI